MIKSEAGDLLHNIFFKTLGERRKDLFLRFARTSAVPGYVFGKVPFFISNFPLPVSVFVFDLIILFWLVLRGGGVVVVVRENIKRGRRCLGWPKIESCDN